MLPRPLVGLAFVLLSLIQFVPAAEISYSRDVQPTFIAKCVACHACYDSSCQLNLSSAEGAQRGINQLPAYDGMRTKAREAIRLYLDAYGADAWRRKNPWSVLEPQDGQAALMVRMLELDHSQPLQSNVKIPEGSNISINRVNQRPTSASIDAFVRKNPGSGMSSAVAGLSDDEYATLQKRLAAGAPVDWQSLRPTAAEACQVASWERFLNQPGAEQSLVLHWLYEHLFLAYLYFPEQSAPGHFFQLVHLRAPSGQSIDPIPTRRSNDDPGNSFYYRLQPIQGVTIHKTHITYPLAAKKLERVQELFLGTQRNTDKVLNYGMQSRADPFATLATASPRVCYQFMLDNAKYFTRTFIRGPACRGQVVTDVIHDNLWVVFQDSEQDLFVTDANFRAQSESLLVLPGQIDELRNLLGLQSTYRGKRSEYEDLRQGAYADAPPPTRNTIWHGNDSTPLSIFRQSDSASVRKGLLGEVPQVLWLMDYPLLERTYCGLVTNPDVFGNISHQAQTRLYFDLIRSDVEQNFLRLMPVNARQSLLNDWYQNSGKLKMWMGYQAFDDDTPGALGPPEKQSKKAFIEELLCRHGDLSTRPDSINRCLDGNCYRPGIDRELQDVEQTFSRLVSRPTAGLKAIERSPEVAMPRIRTSSGKREIYTVLRNRTHNNVAFMLGKSLHRQPGLDTLTIYPGVLLSYPNFMFDLPVMDAEAFVGVLETAKSSEDLDKVVECWGVRHSNPRLWNYFHDLEAYIRETELVETGASNMNRYENL